MDKLKYDEVRSAVRETYKKVAVLESAGCGCSSSCCGTTTAGTAANVSLGLGFSGEDVEMVPEGANMGLGCGNPQAIASLQAGFENIRIRSKDESRTFIREWMPGSKAEDYVVSATIEAIKPQS
jgi:hypothetical protein